MYCTAPPQQKRKKGFDSCFFPSQELIKLKQPITKKGLVGWLKV
jgi:hypothetical protein